MDTKNQGLALSTLSTHNLASWEIGFAKALGQVDQAKRQKAGALLPIVPDHAKWEDFLKATKAEWKTWRNNLMSHPTCLLVLFGGLAFFEYDENTFWPYFAKAVGGGSIFPNQQGEIGNAFSETAEKLGLKIHRSGRTSYVGSAVYHIGIPLSLWDGFLDICEWALWREGWKTLSQQEWEEVIEKRTGSRLRLRRFLVDNREVASSFIEEILDAREILNKDVTLTVRDIAQASVLRIEYFEEVPETAEFLRPVDPDSLFQDRAGIVWNDQKQQISLYLPAVKAERLPAIWKLGLHTQKAATTPDEMILNSEAFYADLLLRLESGQRSEPQRLHGVDPWGLFDLESGGLVNLNRDAMPLKSYALISRKEVGDLRRQGFDEEDNSANEPIQLTDGTTCFVTRLWPIGKFASLELGDSRTIHFRTTAKIEAQFFVGKGYRAAFFSPIADDVIKIEDLPTLCVSIPSGYFGDNQAELGAKFRVFMDDKLAGGHWERFFSVGDDDREFYFWKWSRKPFMEPRRGVGTIKSFGQLPEAYVSPDLKGERTFSIKAPALTVDYKVYLDHSKRGMEECWKDLPGPFLPWFLLCQSKRGMKWEDLMLAKDVIAPHQRVSYYLLRKYADRGFFLQQGRKWLIRESHAVVTRISAEQSCLEYCGDPSILWGLYRLMYHRTPSHELPKIAVVDRRGEVPYLRMVWDFSLCRELERYLTKNNVVMSNSLWTH